MADTGTAPAPMTAEERARRCLGALGILGDHERVTTIVATIAAHICAAETKAEQRGAERELERLAQEFDDAAWPMGAAFVRARAQQQEPA